MPAHKGTQPPGGSRLGRPNKTTLAVKEAIEHVYAALQEGEKKPHGHFVQWARDNATEYYKLYAKLLPKEIDATVKGRVVVVIDDRD
jgi:hypothetical protein